MMRDAPIRSASFSRASWTMAGVFALHVAEEAPGFASWARRNASPRYTDSDFAQINSLGLAITTLGTAAVNRWTGRRVYLGYHTFVLTQQALFNPLFHAGTTVAYAEYSPGLVTSVCLFWPLWWRITSIAMRDGRLSRRASLLSAVAAGAIHGAAVARQVYFVGVSAEQVDGARDYEHERSQRDS